MPSSPSSAAIALGFMLILVGSAEIGVALGVVALVFEAFLFYVAGSDG